MILLNQWPGVAQKPRQPWLFSNVPAGTKFERIYRDGILKLATSRSDPIISVRFSLNVFPGRNKVPLDVSALLGNFFQPAGFFRDGLADPNGFKPPGSIFRLFLQFAGYLN